MAKKGKKVIPEVMIPPIGAASRSWKTSEEKIVVQIADEVLEKAGMKDYRKYLVGTMIEILRAALTADTVATEAEFFSFGTNDLTQTGMGISRDDYTTFKQDYEDKKIWPSDPFAVLDQEGIGQLIVMAVEKGRKTRPELEIGIPRQSTDGEPSSVQFWLSRGNELCVLLPVPRADREVGSAAQAAISGR